jgi:Na+/melibiose symporter-like transporter
VLVLYAGDRLGMDEVGFGLLTTAVAIGGVIGIVSYGPLERRFSLGGIMRVGLIIETMTHLSLALTTSSSVALATLVVFGAHAFVWGATSTVVRQRAVPDELLGRVSGVYRMAIMAEW